MTSAQALKRVRFFANEWLKRDNDLREALTIVADLAEKRLEEHPEDARSD
jgi:hypothetical protein